MKQHQEAIEDNEPENQGERRIIRGDNFPIVDLKEYNTEEEEARFIQINQVIEKLVGDKNLKKLMRMRSKRRCLYSCSI